MFTIFHLLVLVGVVFGAAHVGALGAKYLGIAGGVIGAVAGGYLGLVVSRLPYILLLRWLAGKMRVKSVGELRDELHQPDCLTPNLLLLALKHRGEDILCELPLVLDLLVSEDTGKRGRGWAALTSAYPELAEKLSGYSISDPVDVCHRKINFLREVEK